MPIKYLTSDTRGLSLIECVIAILILSVSLAGGLSLYFNATSIMSLAMHKKMAVEIAVQDLARADDDGFAIAKSSKVFIYDKLRGEYGI